MTQILPMIESWAKTQNDKSEAKLIVSGVQGWVNELPNLDEIITGSQKFPALPEDSPAWATTMLNFLTSSVSMTPGLVKGIVQDLSADLQNAIRELTDEIGTFISPPKDSTPSQTAALSNASKAIKLLTNFPNSPKAVEALSLIKEAVGYINKIPAEAIAGDKA